jgi:5-(carboxyamino)imidazole ribonucleotide synthase
VAKVTELSTPPSLGVIGAGQLARMMAESASELGIDVVVLAANPLDSACNAASRVIVGEPSDGQALLNLSNGVDAVTLDHELVDGDVLEWLEARDVTLHPSPRAVKFAANKSFQRLEFSAAGITVPRFAVMSEWNAATFDEFAASIAAVPVIKAASGGYDGRGVAFCSSLDAARELAREWTIDGEIVLEEPLELLGEIAALIVTSASGERKSWPIVRTVQHDAMCSEVQYPCGLDDDTITRAHALADQVAATVNAVGVMAVEMFVTPTGVVVNEVATRPHNSGHWTIEGSLTSQFENHVRAVLGLPLGATDVTANAVVMVNVVGSSQPGSLAQALAVPGVHVHDYGKQWRPKRKLGHVTATGNSVADARVRAWEAAEALGTSATKEPCE